MVRLPRSAMHKAPINYAQVAYDACISRAKNGMDLGRGAIKEIHRDYHVDIDDYGIEIIMSDMMKIKPHPTEW